MKTIRPLHVREKLILAALIILALATSRLFAATFVVNSTEDRPDSDPLDGVCSATVTGACTLRAAIMEANAGPGADIIVVPAGVYQITRVSFDDNALGGDLDITASLTIHGAGVGATIVDGNGEVTNDRVFHILGNAGPVTLKGMTIRHGKPTVAEAGFFGGGIYAASKNLTLTDLVIEENTATQGGGLYILGNNGGPDTLSNLVVQNNTATNVYGGGISIEAAVVDLTNIVLTGNSVVGRGGGLSAYGSSVTMTDCEIHHNTAGSGGGIAGGGLLTRKLVRCEIFSNTAANTGGGIENDGDGGLFSLTECHFHDNHATHGGGIDNLGNLVLLRTLIEANSAEHDRRRHAGSGERCTGERCDFD